MPDVRVTIDDREVMVPAGSTVLDAANAAGVELPTLCAHPAIEPIGACRICLVEVEKQRVLQPACTFPVSDGMVVHTDSEKVLDARKFVLNLLFSERNHFCMFCQMSGSCELQDLAYAAGLDHWRYDRAYPKLPVDASRKFFVMDHNRCILCRRCIRVCDELVGNHTLGLKNRGASTMIVADLDIPFGESSCISCGTCLQVCPTGALMDRASAYLGEENEIERVKSTCMACPVGCGVEYVVRENRVIRIDGDWDAMPNKGLLCELGRFAPLHEQRSRAYQPMVKGASGLEKASWDDALAKAAAAVKAAGDDVLTLVSGYATNETAAALTALPGCKGLLDGPAGDGAVDMAALDAADLFVVVNTDLTQVDQVAGMAVKRGVSNKGAKLLLVGEGCDGLASYALKQYGADDVAGAVALAKDAQSAVVIAGPEGACLAKEIAEAVGCKAALFGSAGNSQGLVAAGITCACKGAKKVCYVFAGETATVDADLLATLEGVDFVVVQTSYLEPWCDVADVILPTPTTPEKSGTTTTAEGTVKQIVAAVNTKRPSEVDVVERLSALL